MKFIKSDFMSFCESPNVAVSGKSESYARAIEYLCNFLEVNLSNFSETDLSLIKQNEQFLHITSSDFYKQFLAKLENEGRSSYLKNGFIRAALPYFYQYLDWSKQRKYL